MNRELMLRVADFIEAHPERFDMDQWLTDCGTGGCIAGTTVILAGARDDLRPDRLAQQLLGLTEEEAMSLFYAVEWPEDLYDAVLYGKLTEAQAAVQLLRRMAGPGGG